MCCASLLFGRRSSVVRLEIQRLHDVVEGPQLQRLASGLKSPGRERSYARRPRVTPGDPHGPVRLTRHGGSPDWAISVGMWGVFSGR